MTNYDGVVGGISTQLARACVPWMAFALSISLTLVMVLVNHSELETKPQQMVITAIFCIVGSAMYLIYMSVNRLLSIVLMSIESTDYGTLKRKRSHRLAHLTSTASNPKPSAADVEEAVKIAEGYEEEEEEEEDNIKPLLSASMQKEREWKGVRREDIIASMYLGGSGAFLALPALCMWDTSVTVAFLASMQFGSVWEKVKVLEYKPNVDRVTAIGILRGLHWSQHLLMMLLLSIVLWQDWHTRPAHMEWPMVCISVLSPALLRLGCQRLNDPLTPSVTGLTPTHALETGLPVSTLLGTLLLCWYSPLGDILQTNVVWAQVIPMFLICPPAIAASLACILRGFRRRQTIGTCVLLTTAMVIRRQVKKAFLLKTFPNEKTTT